MSNIADNELINFEQMSEIEKKQTQLLIQALDLRKSKKDAYFAQRVNMGDAGNKSDDTSLPSYVTVQTLNFVSEKILMGSQMPFMKDKMDEKGKLILDDESIEMIMQRAPDWTRQIELTAYLLRDNHKFTSILAVAQPSWLTDDKSPNWDKEGKAKKDAISFDKLTSDGSFGVMSLENLTLFALDGQHRIMGVRGIKELIDKGHITYKDKNGYEKRNEFEKREDLLYKLKCTSSALNKILNETISIEFIPAILKNETREEARIRLRNYFVDVNKYAKKIQKGDEASLDETDGYKIVGRNVGFKHPIFVTDRMNKINRTDQSIPKASNYITTGFALTVIAQNYLKNSDPDRSWQPLFKNIIVRPSEKELALAKMQLTSFFDEMQELSVFKRIERGESISKLREFPEQNQNKKNYEEGKLNEGHLLLRPIGQQILADAVGRLVAKGNNLKSIFSAIEKVEKAGHFNTHKPSSIFYGVTVDISGKRMITNYQEQAANYLEYLLSGEPNQKIQKKYLEEIVDKRSDPTDPELWIDFDGKKSKKSNLEKVFLPKPVI